MTSDLPARPTSATVAAALVRAADGEALLADRSAAVTWWGVQHLDTVSGWQLAVWWVRGRLGPLHRAIDPAGLEWIHGCARWPDWSPGSVPLDPIEHLLTSEQRQQLQARLSTALCWPAPQAPMASIMPLLDLSDDSSGA